MRTCTSFGQIVRQGCGGICRQEDIAAKWFKEPARRLGGQTPLAFAETKLGAQQIRTLLIRIEHGVFPG
ncbi:MAG: DUF2384 domain-containing protein [Deltaproteobacteria bacterium]|nr:DUF2384 domain-containing protein [Deltaproteobacteria bacterium]